MAIDNQTEKYLSQQRWCNFKEELRRKEVEEVKFTSVPLDNNSENHSILAIGEIDIASHNNKNIGKKYFMIPLSTTAEKDENTIEIEGIRYKDAVQDKDYWQKVITDFANNKNKLTSANDWQIEYKNIGKKYFMIPFSTTAEKEEKDENTIEIEGIRYKDALQDEDYWQKMMTTFANNKNKLTFANGWQIEYKNIGMPEVVAENINSPSKPLGVEQSNTTLSVGNGAIAFKLERMLAFSDEVNPEFEMNEKLMREKCPVMPKTYGYLILRDNEGRTSSSGIIQEYVDNNGDLWNYAVSYIKEQLRAGYNEKKPLTAKENPQFMQLMKKLSQKTEQMSESLSRPDENPNFTPVAVDDKFIYIYEKQMQVLTYKTHRSISENITKLPEDTRKKAESLLNNWDSLTTKYVSDNLNRLKKSENKGLTVRVHGDFHLGQVLVTKDNDLRFIDFAGEPDLPLEQRKQKHIEVRDIAGMYRSIQGYLGAVSAEEFAAEAKDETEIKARKQYASKAVKPLINASAKVFLGNHSLKEPWMGLEVLRKNLYEVNYEVNNRPQMAYVAIDGLCDLLSANENQQILNHQKDNQR